MTRNKREIPKNKRQNPDKLQNTMQNSKQTTERFGIWIFEFGAVCLLVLDFGIWIGS
jgi:hypothetical protein